MEKNNEQPTNLTVNPDAEQYVISARSVKHFAQLLEKTQLPFTEGKEWLAELIRSANNRHNIKSIIYQQAELYNIVDAADCILDV